MLGGKDLKTGDASSEGEVVGLKELVVGRIRGRVKIHLDVTFHLNWVNY